jgi:hypothetical protein
VDCARVRKKLPRLNASINLKGEIVFAYCPLRERVIQLAVVELGVLANAPGILGSLDTPCFDYVAGPMT